MCFLTSFSWIYKTVQFIDADTRMSLFFYSNRLGVIISHSSMWIQRPTSVALKKFFHQLTLFFWHQAVKFCHVWDNFLIPADFLPMDLIFKNCPRDINAMSAGSFLQIFWLYPVYDSVACNINCCACLVEIFCSLWEWHPKWLF